MPVRLSNRTSLGANGWGPQTGDPRWAKIMFSHSIPPTPGPQAAASFSVAEDEGVRQRGEPNYA